MIIDAPSQFRQPAQPSGGGVTRRGLLKAGLGLTGVAGLVMPSTAAYAAVEAANDLGSDLIVILGDYFATHRFVTERVPHPVWAAELARLMARLGFYAILGNHDWWYDIKGVRHALAAVRMPVLENDAVLLNDGGRRFWLAGLGDRLAHWTGPSHFQGVDDLPGTLERITTDDPVILLAHEPDIFTAVPPA